MPHRTARALLGASPTPAQLQYELGSPERVFGVISVSWLGPLVLAFATDSGIIGGFESTLGGTLAASYLVWGPALRSMFRGSWALSRASHAGIVCGFVADVRRLAIGANAVVRVEGNLGRRTYEITVPWTADVGALTAGMDAFLLVLERRSRKQAPESVLISECYVPEAEVYIGDYPYLDRRRFETFLRDRIFPDHPPLRGEER